MLRKALTLGMVFIFALSLLAVSMITCFTYDAEAHPWKCIKWRECDENGQNCVDHIWCWHEDHFETG